MGSIALKLAMGSNWTMAELRIRDLDDSLHKALRHLAVERNVSLNTLVKELLQQAMDRSGRK